MPASFGVRRRRIKGDSREASPQMYWFVKFCMVFRAGLHLSSLCVSPACQLRRLWR